MSNPVLESFCCVLKHKANHSSDNGILAARHVSLSYDLLCLFASIIGICGCLYQLYPRLPHKSIRHPTKLAGYIRQNYIITWLAVADLLAALGILVRSILWLTGVFSMHRTVDAPVSLSDPDIKHVLCGFLSAWIQYFYICTYLWTFCYAIDVYLYVNGRPGVRSVYRVVGWLVSLIVCVVGVIPMYYPSLVHCVWTIGHVVPHYLASYTPMLLVMTINPIFFKMSSNSIRRSLRAMGHYTDDERKVVLSVQMKFFKIIVVFYICWLPNIVNGILLLVGDRVPTDARVGVWLIMAILNPLQGFFNAMLFHRLGGAYCYVSKWMDNNPSNLFRPLDQRSLDESQETSPLLSFRREDL